MKLAIIGSSPIACEAAVRFHLHGAAITWFNHEVIEPESLFKSAVIDWKSRSSEMGRGFLARAGVTVPSGTWTWKDWKNYSLNMAGLLKADQEIKPHPVVTVTKRFLGPGEKIAGKSRFHDLYRVIYQVNPQDFISEQKESDPETYKRLSQELVESLQTTLEMYEDFDLILDLRRPSVAKSIAHSGRALGEYKMGQDKVTYGLETLTRLQTFTSNNIREVALVGSGALAAEILIEMQEWLKDERTRLFVISTEEDPFAEFLSECLKETAVKLRQVFQYMEDEFEKEIEVFTKKLRDWQELDDFVQVKIPKPTEPIPRLNYFSGHNVTAIDLLIDKRRLFLTLERPDFRDGKKHPENNNLELKTIGVDEILVANGFDKVEMKIGLDGNEVGFFSLTPEEILRANSWENDLAKLKGIEDEIFKLFSPTGTH